MYFRVVEGRYETAVRKGRHQLPHVGIIRPRPGLHMSVLTVQEPKDTITAALATLPPLERSVVVAYFMDGDPVGRIMRRHKLKRSEVVAAIESALAAMKNALRGRGIRTMADVI